MSIAACAALVERGDPDRFLAAMAAPLAARRVLFPLYAFNLEVARAPWVTQEPMIAEMRLQWWRDVLGEIREGRPVRRHEVTTPLADVLTGDATGPLEDVIDARRWDLNRQPFPNDAAFHGYLEQTGGALLWVAAKVLGAPDSVAPDLRALGAASAFARFAIALPEFAALGRQPFSDPPVDVIARGAAHHLAAFPNLRALRQSLPASARPALLEAWQARRLLVNLKADPTRAESGGAQLPEFRKRLMLLLASLKT